ncbi:glycoside hydrolase family 57 protein [Limisalsivibrio acetivorans]|uniref:glycoside hydrolase family 57 protein n=1 Tax=Limisalsivibrio acetivorans TaxID=1304888 RepID=UPI0003B38B64|nr:glycoside hydrolase family 57 protein [Limisalsivibrio acetivorans]
MKKLHLVFLWHMHQPYYRDDADGVFHMPWVFLHAVKDYYEIPAYLKEYKGIKQTFNVVPSLLEQLDDYRDPSVEDTFIKLLSREPSELSSEEKSTLIPQLFMANYSNMIAPFRRFAELYSRKSRGSMFDSPDKLFNAEEILDLEVLYLLSWTGNFFRREYPVVAELIEKGRGYSQDDKTKLIEALCDSVGRIVPLYKELMEKGVIEVSVTPYYHPILPLLIDLESAKEALPEISMPAASNAFEDDYKWHVVEALKYYENIFGRRAEGMWPAEGSISEAAAETFAANGVEWIASDEDVLAGSMETNLTLSENRKLLYRRHYYERNGRRINIYFRDKILSDLIGFTYSGWEPERAADDFIQKLRVIYDSMDDSPLVPVILDGENAWEYYKENGEPFFRALYKRLEETEWLDTVTMSEGVRLSDVPENRLDKIRAGSWIYGDFTTWLGHSEKNEAWRLLSEARKAVNYTDDKERIEKAMREIHIAEGSDWFWWFGDDHFSLQSDLFDKLFRNHLKNVYDAVGVKPPADLFIPIKKSHKSGIVRKPNYFLSPVVDGQVTSFFEWLSAGEFDLKFDAGAMHASSSSLKKLYYGWDENCLYLRVEGELASIMERGRELEIEITIDDVKIFRIPLAGGSGQTEEGVFYHFGRIAEVGVPFTSIFKDSWKRLYLVLRVKDGEDIVERAPLYNMVEIDVTEDFEDDWIV